MQGRIKVPGPTYYVDLEIYLSVVNSLFDLSLEVSLIVIIISKPVTNQSPLQKGF